MGAGRSWVCAVLAALLPLVARAEERAAWVGLSVSKLEEAMRAQVPEVPAGVGFLITSVDAGGPAEGAGLRPYDILWKLEDQLLVNEAQFAALLALRKPGELVNLTVMRSGRQQQVAVALTEAPPRASGMPVPPAELPLVPTGIPGMPRTIVYPRARTAEVSREDGSMASLRYDEGVAVVTLTGPSGEAIYDGPIEKDGVLAVPIEWRGTVAALMRALSHAENPAWQPRRPRPRVVLPPAATQE